MNKFAILSLVLLISSASYASTSASNSANNINQNTTNEIVKNVGIALGSCSISYSAKVLIAVGETIPALSGFIKLGNDMREDTKELRAIIQKEHYDADTYTGHGRNFSSFFFGGIIATAYESLAQVGSGELNTAEIKQAFADGYFVTRSETKGTKACAAAATRIKQLLNQSLQ